MIYIYTLSNPETGVVRYVGKSINPNGRVVKHINESKSGRYNNHRVNWIKSLTDKGLKPKMDIIDEVDGEWGWLEEYWISQFKTWGFDLTNGTVGGESPPSYSVKVDQYTLEGTFVKTWDSATEGAISVGLKTSSSISLACSGKGFKGGRFRWTYSGEELHNFKRKPNNELKVDQYTLEGVFVKTWGSISEGAKSVGLKNPSGVSLVCLGERFKSGGFRWAYSGEKLCDYIHKPKGGGNFITEETRKKAYEVSRVKVNQYTLEGIFVKTWDSITEASNFLESKSSSGISDVLSGKNFTCGGFRWSYLDEVLKPYKLKIGKSVKQLDLSGNLLTVWSSTKEIRDKLGFNSNCVAKACSGGLKTYKKYKWVWVEDKL